MPPDAAQGMTTADWAFVVSLCSFAVALASFLWNVWSKFIYPKPKVKVTFHSMLSIAVGPGTEGLPPDRFIKLSATNFGPGAVTLDSAVGRAKRHLFAKRTDGIFLPRPSYSREPGLPAKIEVGETFNFFMVINHQHLRDDGYFDVGFTDTFGRTHWAPRRHVRKVVASINEHFPRQ